MSDAEISGNIGPYEVRRLLGKGGMGTVYLAADHALDRPVAIKVLPLHLSEDEAIVARFQREARAIAKLRHPNLMHIYTVGEHEGRPYFAMEYVKGSTLAFVLAQTGPMPPAQAAQVAGEVLAALDKVHGAGIVHRDIKPANIMIDEDGRTILMDFGLARQAEEVPLTGDHTVLGTPNYMSPEQAKGDPVDPRCDIYSLGIVLYEMLTGAAPFMGKSSFEILRLHIVSSVPPPSEFLPGVPGALDQIVATAVAKSADDRYEDVRQMAAALGAVLPSPTLLRLAGASGSTSGPTVLLPQAGGMVASTVRLPTTVASGGVSAGRRGWLAAALAAAVLVLAGLLAWPVLRPGPDAAPGQLVEIHLRGADTVRGRLIAIEVLDDGTTMAKIGEEGSEAERTFSIREGDELRVVTEQ